MEFYQVLERAITSGETPMKGMDMPLNNTDEMRDNPGG